MFGICFAVYEGRRGCVLRGGTLLKRLTATLMVGCLLASLAGIANAAPTMVKLDYPTLSGFIPADVVGAAIDQLRLGDGVQGVGGVPFFLDSNGVIDDSDDAFDYDVPWDIFLGPATRTDTNFHQSPYSRGSIDIDALLIVICIDTSEVNFVSNGGTIESITFSEALYGAITLTASDFHSLSDVGLRSGGGGESFNPTDDDLVAAILLSGLDFNAGQGTDIGDFTISVTGIIGNRNLRVDLFGVDLSLGLIVSSGPNSSGGYGNIVPEPATLALFGLTLLAFPLLRRRRARHK